MRLIAFVSLAILASGAIASSGDMRDDFRSCVKTCTDQYCSRENPKTFLDLSLLDDNSQSFSADFPRPHTTWIRRKLLDWGCGTECDYTCQERITMALEMRREPLEQFHGKWFFWRCWPGIQEPASVLFSLLNLLTHIFGATQFNRYFRSKQALNAARLKSQLWPYYWGIPLTGAMAWICSIVYHMHDRSLTERLDYVFAAITVLYNCTFVLIRLFWLKRVEPNAMPMLSEQSGDTQNEDKSMERGFKTDDDDCSGVSVDTVVSAGTDSDAGTNVSKSIKQFALVSHVLFIAFVLVGIYHLLYLCLRPRIDYTYNMHFNVTVGLVHNVCWFAYSLHARHKRCYPRWSIWPALIASALTLAVCLELYDFAPLWHFIDAHSLWHLATAPCYYFYYQFLIKDAMYTGVDIHTD